jgi:hypothetical protein
MPKEAFVTFTAGLWKMVFPVCCLIGIAAAQSDELDREIVRLKKEIARVASQRQNEAQQAKEEQKEFLVYKERTASRTTAIRRQTDSLQAGGRLSTSRNDSLRAVLASLQAGIRDQELQVKKIRSVITAAVKKLQGELPSLPPLITEQYAGPVGFLLTELEAGSVENTEALHRLMRLVQDLRTVAQEIQVVEGVSPTPQLHGSVYRLRIGAVFEAVVDQNGSRAYLWTPAGEGSDSLWVPAGNSETAGEVLKAVKIREGKTVPELVELPLAPAPAGPKEATDAR